LDLLDRECKVAEQTERAYKKQMRKETGERREWETLKATAEKWGEG
jgi:hypothetical protein